MLTSLLVVLYGSYSCFTSKFLFLSSGVGKLCSQDVISANFSLQYCPEVMLQSLTSAQIQAMTRHNVKLEYIMYEGTRLLEQPTEGARVSWLHVVS